MTNENCILFVGGPLDGTKKTLKELPKGAASSMTYKQGDKETSYYCYVLYIGGGAFVVYAPAGTKEIDLASNLISGYAPKTSSTK